MFKAVKELNKKQQENLKVEDTNGKLAINPHDTLNIVAGFFKEKFQSETATEIEAFTGSPGKLHQTITKKEVKKSFDNLNNNRAPGEDGIHAELLQYGTQELNKEIAKILNQTFERHENLDINAGELIAIPKPGKPKGPPKSLRPITLLNTIRKALSKIVLERMRPHVEQYLSHSQSGFRPNRSTPDVAWIHKWLAAKVNIENIAIKIAGIDMSAAFDTINRETLLKILEDIVNEEEHRITRFLLSNTIIDTKIIGATEKKPFFSNVGTTQGDSLSPVLFTIYLEHALKEFLPITAEHGHLHNHKKKDAFHRKQLKKALNIKYPVKITNSSLYNKCNERPLSIFILESRWRLFGHILRRDSQIPANQAMSRYFVTEGSKFKGRPLTTLPVVLNRDLSRIINSNLQLKSSHDLEHLRSFYSTAERRVDQAYSEGSRSSRGVPVGALRCERP
ncbi:very-long-chain enoyl-CoA reductase [Elysia marginata]|uniref:Very-long-chain enoyl-CoA reductase n=1 Tax=Elysia marginata TaxID=1093978 RepID=A0AAV4GM09_9GAST|nr:very-long-chain enoyl-CoA reductase [Elysia marginata]